MELCGVNTLSTYCRDSSTKRLPEDQCYKIFCQIVAGVEHMHNLNFAHRDLKMTNILIDQNNAVKIIDFGFACNATRLHSMYCGTPSYMPPEIVQKGSYFAKPVDIWTLGCVLYKLVTSEYPFGAENEPNLKKNILEVKVNYYFYISPKLKDLIKQCLSFNPKDRPSIQQVRDHAWMKMHETTQSG